MVTREFERDGVAEVVAFATSGPLFSGTDVEPDGVLVVRDFHEAARWALQQPPDSPSPVDWTDLREHHASHLIAREYALAAAERSELKRRSTELAEFLYRTVFPRLKALGFDRVANEVEVDLWKVATSRLLPGPRNTFWESVFALYGQGLWPCGWDGEQLSEGRFAVFVPPR